MGEARRKPPPGSLPQGAGSPTLPRDFRKLSMSERRKALHHAIAQSEETGTSQLEGSLEWSDAMVESAIGYVGVPFGVATGFLIDGRVFNIPMAVEEPSVIAAATFGGTMIASAGGFSTWATRPEMISQIFLEGVPASREQELLDREGEIAAELAPLLSSMRERGGGYRSLSVTRIAEPEIVRVDLLIDVCDAMGANIVNSAAERARPIVEAISGGRALMCILTNDSLHRRAGARFALPLARLRRATITGPEAGRRIVLASQIAQADPSRAVTHNKGIMNGISALALATGNDTRGIEAAAHRFASRDGSYRGLSTFRVEGDRLVGEMELPLPIATRGGSIGFHPSTRTALALLGRPDSATLSRVAAALGLAQNFAALHALVTEGIQKGHMKMHSARLALLAGARGEEVRSIAEQIARAGRYTLRAAKELLGQHRASGNA